MHLKYITRMGGFSFLFTDLVAREKKVLKELRIFFFLIRKEGPGDEE